VGFTYGVGRQYCTEAASKRGLYFWPGVGAGYGKRTSELPDRPGKPSSDNASSERHIPVITIGINQNTGCLAPWQPACPPADRALTIGGLLGGIGDSIDRSRGDAALFHTRAS
jgi:hypothetical protein